MTRSTLRTPESAAEILGPDVVTVSLLKRMARVGAWPCHRMPGNGRIVFSDADLDDIYERIAEPAESVPQVRDMTVTRLRTRRARPKPRARQRRRA